MKIPLYQVDAFATRVFEGNPAAVCPLTAWLDDRLLQAIASENKLSETAFFVPGTRGFHLRWFTPKAEVELCGHATLATAHVLFTHLGYAENRIVFETRSGDLTVALAGDMLSMDFPARRAIPCPLPDGLVDALGHTPREVRAADDYVAIFDSEEIVRALAPDFAALARLDRRGVIVTAPGEDVDFVSRFFAPKLGIPEDPVTGSAHCALAPYWADRLGKDTLHARQVSTRGGQLKCQHRGERVTLIGSAVTFMVGEIDLGD